MSKSGSSQRWLKRHERDEYVQKARAQGLRSRAVFKLEQIQHKDRILHAGQIVLDLGAAPGGWSEYASSIVGPEGRVLALDLLPMEPIAGVDFVQGDFTADETFKRLQALIDGRPIDLVISDMAPNLSGMSSVDQPKAAYLAELALDTARECLKPGGAFVVKLFQGEGFDSLLRNLRDTFASVRLRKPAASSSRSSEIYAVCIGLKQT